MNTTLNPVIAAYVDAANTGDAAQLAACFTTDAVVKDEGHDYRGRAAIAAWAVDTRAKYATVMTPTATHTDGDTVVVQAAVAGTFPGSPLSLHFHFTLADAAIARLEIKP